MTWDDDDAERIKLTRRAFTRKEMEENDFRAYIASSSDDESDAEAASKGKADREKLRALLLSGRDDLPEGWGKGFDGEDVDADDVDMQVTFAPGLSEAKGAEDETTLEKYQRKMKEKKKRRKDEMKEKAEEQKERPDDEEKDDFFGDDSEDEVPAPEPAPNPKKGKKAKGKHSAIDDAEEESRAPDRKSTRLNSSHSGESRMPSSA